MGLRLQGVKPLCPLRGGGWRREGPWEEGHGEGRSRLLHLHPQKHKRTSVTHRGAPLSGPRRMPGCERRVAGDCASFTLCSQKRAQGLGRSSYSASVCKIESQIEEIRLKLRLFVVQPATINTRPCARTGVSLPPWGLRVPFVPLEMQTAGSWVPFSRSRKHPCPSSTVLLFATA